jgi:hypothetical protein
MIRGEDRLMNKLCTLSCADAELDSDAETATVTGTPCAQAEDHESTTCCDTWDDGVLYVHVA